MPRLISLISLLVASFVLALASAASAATPARAKEPKPTTKFTQPFSVHRTPGSQVQRNDCAEVKSTLRAKARSLKKPTKAICVDHTPPSAAAITMMEKKRAAKVKESAPAPFPPVCVNTNSDLNWKQTRHIGCRAWLWSRPEVWRADSTGNVVQVGAVQVRTIQEASTPTVYGQTQWYHRISTQVMNINGQVAGMKMQGSGACFTPGSSAPNCAAQFPNLIPLQSVDKLTDQPEGGVTFIQTAVTTPGQIAYSSSEITIKFELAGATKIGGVESKLWQTDYIRCDNALPGVTSRGCVFFRHQPTYAVSRTGMLSLYAAHLRDALKSGLPGAATAADGPNNTPLRRLTDQTLRTQNGDRACPSRYPRPKTPVEHECDEYPFRSTWQGARTAADANPNTPWTARTHDWCQIFDNLTPIGVTGPNGYSVCMIPKTHNGGGGNDLLKFYNDNRIIEKDGYFVHTY